MHPPSPLQAYVGINWILTDEHLDVETELALGFLDYLMLGTNAAPLRKVWGSGGSEGVDYLMLGTNAAPLRKVWGREGSGPTQDQAEG